MALDAEHGRLAAVPIGLINGTAHDGRPHPPAVLAAVRRTVEQPAAADSELLGLLGAGGPQSLTGIVSQIRAWANATRTRTRLLHSLPWRTRCDQLPGALGHPRA